jgi:outer membrane receptor protein involved in Fe transport
MTNTKPNDPVGSDFATGQHPPHSPTRIALAVAGAVILASAPAYSADDKVVDDLKAEVARLKQALEQKEQELASQRGAPAEAAPAPEQPAVTEQPPAEQAAEAEKAEEPKTLGEVVAKATRGLVKKKDVPSSSSVITGQHLEETGAYTIADFTKRAANLQRDTGNPRTLSIGIRGIGRKGITEAQDPSVGTSIDGISFAYNSLATWDQVDVESIEVNRGPQGTLGGKNTSLGGINITTRGPSFTPGGRYAMRFGMYDTFYGDLSYGGPIVNDLLAWRGTFFVHKNAGVYQNDYDLRGRTYIDTNKISGRVQFLLTPSENFSARLRVDVQPRTAENFNGLNFFHKEPAAYSNGNGYNHATTAFNRLQRGWFRQLPNYGLYENYYNFRTGRQNNDNQLALETGMNGVSGEMNWRLGTHTLTSITGWKDFWFDARNDEGTPYDVSLQGGGGVRYDQFSQELRLASEKGGFVDYVTGLYYIKTRTNVDAKTGWGSDAGYWFAGGTPTLFASPDVTNTTAVTTPIAGPAYTHNVVDRLTGKLGLVYGGVYGRMMNDNQARYLLGDALNGLRTLGQLQIRNESPAWYGNANWHLTDNFTLNTGVRVTQEDRTTRGFKIITNDGYAGILNPSVSNFGVKMGGFDSVFVSAAGRGGYNALGPDGKWHTYDYNKNFDPTKDFNTYVVDNKIVSKAAWVKAGSPATANSYATNDNFYVNGAKQGLGTDVTNAFKFNKVGATNATQSVQTGRTSDLVRVEVNTAALTTDRAGFEKALKKADRAAAKYFNVTNTVDASGAITTHAWDKLTAQQQRHIADAQNLRKAQLGPVYGGVVAQPFRKTQLTSVISPIYKINEDITAYATWQHGEKAGISQIVNGVSRLGKPEITESYEIGLKTTLFDKTLILNSDVYYTDISDYQQQVSVLDSYTTALNNDGTLYYTNATLNAKNVKAWGIEVDAAYTGLPNTTLRASGAYTDAWYGSFKNSPLSPEQDPNDPINRKRPFQDLTGKTLPGASKFSFNIGGEYRYPVLDGFDAHTALNYAFQTGYNNDLTLSKYGWVNGYGVADVAVGIGRKDKLFDISFLVRNLLDTQPKAFGISSGTLLTQPRWYGVVLSGQF